MADFIDEWLERTYELCRQPADLYSGCRKILRSQTLIFNGDPRDGTVELKDAGYTKSKYTMLRKHYWHQESIDAAKLLWDHRRSQKSYGSVSFHTYNHLVKGGGTVAEMIAGEGHRSKRASVFGPCIQSVMITKLNKNEAAINVGYRTTELFKKFPADLVLLGDMLREFDFEDMTIKETVFQFANVTLHPMYFVTIIPHMPDPIKSLFAIRAKDPFFHDWIIKWTSRYLVPEMHRGIDKFAQAKRVKQDAKARVPKRMLDKLLPYMRATHPGHLKDYREPSEDDE